MEKCNYLFFDKDEFIKISIQNYLKIKWTTLIQSCTPQDLPNTLENVERQMIKLLSELYNYYLEIRDKQANTHIFYQIMNTLFIVNLPELKELLNNDSNKSPDKINQISDIDNLFKQILSSKIRKTIAYKYQLIARFLCFRDQNEFGDLSNHDKQQYFKDILKLIDMLRLCNDMNEEDSQETFIEYLIEEIIIKSRNLKVFDGILKIAKKAEFSEKILKALDSQIKILKRKPKISDKINDVDNQTKVEKNSQKKLKKSSSKSEKKKNTKYTKYSLEETTNKFRNILRKSQDSSTMIDSKANLKSNMNEEKPGLNSQSVSNAISNYSTLGSFYETLTQINPDDSFDRQECNSILSGYTSHSRSSKSNITALKRNVKSLFQEESSIQKTTSRNNSNNARLVDERNTLISQFKLTSSTIAGELVAKTKTDKNIIDNGRSINSVYSIPITSINTKEEMARKAHRTSLNSNALNRKISKIQVKIKKDKMNEATGITPLPLFTRMASVFSNISSSNGSSNGFLGNEVDNSSPLGKLYRNPSNLSSLYSEYKVKLNDLNNKSPELQKPDEILAESTPVKETLSESSLIWDRFTPKSGKLLDYDEDQ